MHVPITTPALQLPPAGQLLPPIDGLVANEEAHRYCFRGDWLPFSVTGVISDLSEAARKQYRWASSLATKPSIGGRRWPAKGSRRAGLVIGTCKGFRF